MPSRSVVCLFTLLGVCWWTDVLDFNVVLFLSFFLYGSFGSYSTSLSRALKIFSPQGFVLPFTFRPKVRLELVFVCKVSGRGSFKHRSGLDAPAGGPALSPHTPTFTSCFCVALGLNFPLYPMTSLNSLTNFNGLMILLDLLWAESRHLWIMAHPCSIHLSFFTLFSYASPPGRAPVGRIISVQLSGAVSNISLSRMMFLGFLKDFF